MEDLALPCGLVVELKDAFLLCTFKLLSFGRIDRASGRSIGEVGCENLSTKLTLMKASSCILIRSTHDSKQQSEGFHKQSKIRRCHHTVPLFMCYLLRGKPLSPCVSRIEPAISLLIFCICALISWLVVEPYPCEKYEDSSTGMMTFPIWKNNTRSSHHQPVSHGVPCGRCQEQKL